MSNSTWILAGAALCLLMAAVTYWGLLGRRKKPLPLPSDWALTPRPVFNTNERRAYRLLRDALPQHVVLSKLPLVRFCQPVDTSATRYWYDLLGSIHVGFAICSANGRVLAAIDLELDRGTSRRVIQIKQAVLAACRIQYLRCPPDQLPSLDELHQLVPQQAGTAPLTPAQSLPVPAGLTQARESLVTAVASRRAQRTHLWQDANAFQDSFFAPDSRFDSLRGLEFTAEESHEVAAQPTVAPRDHRTHFRDDDVAGVVDDMPGSKHQLRGA
ncbi:MAG: hypothetical protein RIS44_356 [Pseudomonadota bacterium]|jgi:hypothetical protein